MSTYTKSCMTAGVALAGAGAIALAPLTPAAQDVRIEANKTPAVALTAASNPIQAFIDDVTYQVEVSGATRVNDPIAIPPADAPAHIAAGLAASGIRTAQSVVLSPMQLVALASALANGDRAGAAAVIRDTIDGPLWAADPALLSTWEAAPAPIGGEGEYTGAAWTAREAWRTTGNTAESNLLDALNLPKPPKLNTAGSVAGQTTLTKVASPTVQSGAKTVTLKVPAPRPAADAAVDNAPASHGNLFKPAKKANDTGTRSGPQAKGPFSGIRDSVSKTAAKVARSASGKSADK